MSVTRVWVNHMRRTVTAEVMLAGNERLCCEIDPRSLHDVVRQQIGPPPTRPGVADLREAISLSLLGQIWVNPSKVYREAAIEAVRPYASRFMRGHEVPRAAAEAMLDMVDWDAQA